MGKNEAKRNESMRTIKFKAKRVDNGEWIEGNLFVPSGMVAGTFICSRTTYADFAPDFEGGDDINESMKSGSALGHFIEVIPETVCQFTGLPDKNGVDIWEGDRDQYGAVVKFYRGVFTVETEGNVTYSFLSYACENMTVTGNIHDK